MGLVVNFASQADLAATRRIAVFKNLDDSVQAT
jgi:hypothetical protein